MYMNRYVSIILTVPHFLVLVEFADCPTMTSPIDCLQNVNVTEDEPIIFDTSLTYATGSVCGCNQRISRYSFSGPNVSYNCDDQGDCTSMMGNITQLFNETLDNPYNFSLQLHSPKPENGRVFSLQVVGLYPPGIDGAYTATKSFTLNFIPPSKLAALICSYLIQ